MIGSDPVLHAAAPAIVPAFGALPERDRNEFGAVIDRALGERPEAVRRQFGLFLRVLDLAPLLRFGRRFRSLDIDRRIRVLEGLQDSRVLLLRRGVWGLRTIVLMGYYGREAAAAEVGYRAHLRGWLARSTSA